MKRVVITGMSAITPIGQDWKSVFSHLKSYKNAIVYMQEWDRFESLRTRLGAPVLDVDIPTHFTRKKIRGMGRVALLATLATERALTDAGLLNDPEITQGNMGVSYGSCSGTPTAIADFVGMFLHKKVSNINANTYIRMMPHTTPVNIGVFFGLTGRVITTSSACTSGSQGIGYAYETIKHGIQTMMVAGGAEELDATQAAVFDTLFATCTDNDHPQSSPRPFDRDRDGLVIGEGAGTLILEELEHAKARGAKIYAEIVGYASNSDGTHITQPNAATMQIAIEHALKDAHLSASHIGYINAHGTATARGDCAESIATYHVFGHQTPFSSSKSYIGHTLGACGSIEAWMTIEMMNHQWYAPTINLKNIAEDCADLDYIIGTGRHYESEYVMSNNFAFGGVNTSLIFKRWQ
ncbi:MAG: beta-ketoacyl-ACP synthase [Thiomargarita sp.]|nr:beta-ketoacyl-ACP synthase [Thiomargarita sp.]